MRNTDHVSSSPSKIPLKRATLKIRSGCTDYLFQFDETHVAWEISGCSGSESFKFELRLVTSEPNILRKQDPGAIPNIKSGSGFLAAAVVVFFSDFHSMMPLLSPLLTVIGTVRLSRGLSLVPWQEHVVFYEYGREAISIPKATVQEGNLTEFVEGLSAAIVKAKEAHYQ